MKTSMEHLGQAADITHTDRHINSRAHTNIHIKTCAHSNNLSLTYVARSQTHADLKYGISDSDKDEGGGKQMQR